MNQLDKAEAVLAAFRGEVECPSCHHYVNPDVMINWQFEIANSYVTPICRDCWYDGLEKADKEAIARGEYMGEPHNFSVQRYIREMDRARAIHRARLDLQVWAVDWAVDKKVPRRSDD